MDLVVLAGGKSRRLGKDKALLQFGRTTLIEHVINRLGPLFEQVIISSATGSLRAKRSNLHLDAVEVGDIYPGCGSLGGIHTGLSAASSDRAFVIACDMPFVNPDLVRMMMERSETYDIVVPRTGDAQSDDPKLMGLEALHAVYARSCLAHIEELLKQGGLRIFDFFHKVNVCYVGEDEIRRIDPDMRSFFNINTPEDLARAQEILTHNQQEGDSSQ